MKIGNIFVGVIIVLMIVGGLSLFLVDLDDDFGNTLDNTYLSEYRDKIEELDQNVVQPMANETDSSGVLDSSDSDNVKINKGAALKMLLKTPDLTKDLITEAGSALGVPGWFMIGILIIVIVGVILLFIQAVWGRELI